MQSRGKGGEEGKIKKAHGEQDYDVTRQTVQELEDTRLKPEKCRVVHFVRCICQR